MAISNEQMKDMYVKMRRIRDFESAAAKLFAEGKIPGFHSLGPIVLQARSAQTHRK